jgi:hypothetical protein
VILPKITTFDPLIFTLDCYIIVVGEKKRATESIRKETMPEIELPEVDTAYIRCDRCGKLFLTPDEAIRHYFEEQHSELGSWEIVMYSEEDLERIKHGA